MVLGAGSMAVGALARTAAPPEKPTWLLKKKAPRLNMALLGARDRASGR